MAFQQGNQRLDSQTLQRLLVAMYLQSMMQGQGPRRQQGGQPQKQGGTTLDDIVRYYNQIKTGVNAARSGYNLYNNLFGSGSGGSVGSSSGGTGFSSIEEMLGNGYQTPAQVSTPNQSTVPSSATSADSGSVSWGDVAPYLNTAAAIYNAYQAYKNKNLDKDQRNLLMGSAAAQASVPLTGAYGSVLSGVLGTGAALAGKGTEEEKMQQAAHQAGMTVANYYTAGLAGLADGYARNQWGGTMKKIDKFRFNTPGTPEWGLMQVNKLFDTDKWKTEGNRVRKLLESGVDVPEEFRGRMYQKRGLRKEELVNPKYAQDFQGMTADGWVNNKFQNSRNEGDMTYFDLAPYAAWAEKRNDWWKLSDAQRRAITDKAQAAGAVREHHGTLDIDWNKVGDIDQLIKSAPGVQQQIARPGKGQVARVSAGMYMNDRGQVGRALTRNQAMQQNYGQRQIPRGSRR